MYCPLTENVQVIERKKMTDVPPLWFLFQVITNYVPIAVTKYVTTSEMIKICSAYALGEEVVNSFH